MVCQATGRPVGDGYVISDPDFVPVVVPLIKAGVLAMKGLNMVGSLGKMFGLPVPEIPKGVMVRHHCPSFTHSRGSAQSE